MSQEKRADMSSIEQTSAVAHSDHTDIHPQLERRLGLSASFSMITGSMLGIGIFLAPGLAAKHINTSGLFLGAWILNVHLHRDIGGAKQENLQHL